MTQGLRLASWYRQAFIAKSELNISLEEYKEMIPYEIDIYFSLWISRQKKILEKVKRGK